MRLEKDIVLDVPADQALARAALFLTQAGYRPSKGNNIPVEYHRGSLQGSLLGFSPKAWKAVACLRFSEESGVHTLHINLNIRTIGQIVTEAERRFWETELSALAATVLGNRLTDDTPKNTAAKALKQNLLFAVVFLALTALLGFAWGFVANMLFDNRRLAQIVGTVVILFFALLITLKQLRSAR